MPIIFATGPKVSSVNREQAVAAVKKNPEFPKNADDVTVEELDGHWVAAIHVADSPFGGPADESEGSPGPKSEGPGDTAPDEGADEGGEDGPPKPDDGEGPPKDGDEHKGDEKGGDKVLLHTIQEGLQKIMIALGIPDGEAPGESPIPGEEPPAGPPGPPQGGPPGAGGPPAPEKLQHEKALKPGEVPPGQTPVGAPAFAHTISPHPWEGLIGVKATFEVEERVPNEYTAADVDSELNELAHGTGFKVKQVQTRIDEHGHKIAKAQISAY